MLRPNINRTLQYVDSGATVSVIRRGGVAQSFFITTSVDGAHQITRVDYRAIRRDRPTVAVEIRDVE